ncbi:Z1 domain-containing protein [Luteimonas notoginsengisoli]|uniref:Z1 domain-containing protein n=1 Tax=Luteimonas notoginsengisoli TaxID=1578200 RepID=A0ABV7UT81_9GAMM
MNHRDQVLNLLRTQVSNLSEVDDIQRTAEEVAANWANPLSGGQEQTNGLIYGLVQSGKTGVLTATGAIGADEGYKTVIILTSDIDPLYEQTYARAQEAFPGIDILGKKDIKDLESFIQRIKGGTCAIVITKNGSHLRMLIENFKKSSLRGVSCLIIDDEADQASLNTKARRDDGSRSAINELIEEIRSFFHKNTYLQVTATPQALFLQAEEHSFRPKFTILSHPGADYVGGEDFFSDNSLLVHEFPLQDIASLTPGPQPAPSQTIPASLLRALDTFMIAATYKRSSEPTQNCAFLCHVSTKTSDHNHIVSLLRKYKTDLTGSLKSKDQKVVSRLRSAYDDLASTHPPLKQASFDNLLEAVEFFSPGIAVKLVNGQTDEDVAVRSPYNLFVGGNKLGRGVTIKNLLVSYYGRNPRTPQADTVLQHARMYGYRRRDIGLLRLFLPPQLHTVFKAINKMERSLRDLVSSQAAEEFRGIYVEGNLQPTRKNVLVPGAVGVYTAGGSYNPAQVRRDIESSTLTAQIDATLESIPDGEYREFPIETIKRLIGLTQPDPEAAELVWDGLAVAESIGQCANLRNQKTGFVYVDRDRDLVGQRRETQGILTGGEARLVPDTRPAIFMLRTAEKGGRKAAWWPQVRFPAGRYAFAFAI